jgi:hypothetical protein
MSAPAINASEGGRWFAFAQDGRSTRSFAAQGERLTGKGCHA